jgi:cyanophycin synthetase
MISHILSETGSKVGMTTTDGIYLGGEQIAFGDMTGPVSAKTILGDKAVEIAVLETARGGIVRRGLGYDWSDISIITNVSEDHIGQDGIESVEDLINIKALIAERVRPYGTLIVNADDENSLQILERERVKAFPKKIVYFSLDEDNPRMQEHLAEEGIGYFRKDDRIVEAKGNARYTVMEISSIPVTMDGAAEFQVANAMAAIAACRIHGLSCKSVASLQTFRNEADNPGRNNLYKVGKGYALIDYGHNAGAFAAICQMAARWEDKTVTGIIGVPGDRDDRIIKEAGRIAAKGFHRVVIKEDKDPRGRTSGEVARLLCETVTTQAPDRSCEVVLDEVEAFENALWELGENEVVVLFYDKLAPVLEVLQQYEALPVPGFEQSTVSNESLSSV